MEVDDDGYVTRCYEEPEFVETAREIAEMSKCGEE
jgi:hypothetical protein